MKCKIFLSYIKFYFRLILLTFMSSYNYFPLFELELMSPTIHFQFSEVDIVSYKQDFEIFDAKNRIIREFNVFILLNLSREVGIGIC